MTFNYLVQVADSCDDETEGRRFAWEDLNAVGYQHARRSLLSDVDRLLIGMRVKVAHSHCGKRWQILWLVLAQ